MCSFDTKLVACDKSTCALLLMRVLSSSVSAVVILVEKLELAVKEPLILDAI